MQAINEGSYPVSLRGELDPNLSRWLWLVKWLLAIPHFAILIFLWIAFLFSTLIAFFGILFTEDTRRDYSISTLGSCAGTGGWPFTA